MDFTCTIIIITAMISSFMILFYMTRVYLQSLYRYVHLGKNEPYRDLSVVEYLLFIPDAFFNRAIIIHYVTSIPRIN